jgi:hypothetical protein
MTKIQNWRMQACAAVLIEQNDKLLELTKNAGNLPNIILKNLKDTLSITVGLLDRVGSYKPNSEISNEEISRICQRIGNLVVNVEMINIQIKTYNKGEENK